MKVFSHDNALQHQATERVNRTYRWCSSQSLRSPNADTQAHPLAVELVAQSREGESAEQQSEVTECNIEVTWDHQQIDYDQ